MPSFQYSGSNLNSVLTPQPLFQSGGAARVYCSVTGARDQSTTPFEPKMRQVTTMPFASRATASSSIPSSVPEGWLIDRNSSASKTSTQSASCTSGSFWAWFRAEGWGFTPCGMTLWRWWPRPSSSSRCRISTVPSVQSLV